MLELNSDDNEYNETDKPKNKSESGQSPLHNSPILLSSISKARAEKMIGESEPLKDITGEYPIDVLSSTKEVIEYAYT